MRGYLYKDWLLCRRMHLAACIVTIVMLIVLGYALLPDDFFEVALQFAKITDPEVRDAQMQLMRNNAERSLEWNECARSLTLLLLYTSLIPMLFALWISEKLCQMDEKKVWASFAISAPGAARQYVTAKYFFCLLSAMTPMIAFSIFQRSIVAITHLSVDCKSVYIIECFLVLLSFGLTFPFSARFGYKQGNHIRVICVLMLIFIAFIYFLFGNISILQDSDKLGETLYNMVMGTERDASIKWLRTAVYCLSLAAFGLSYPYACKAYAKGVANYDC